MSYWYDQLGGGIGGSVPCVKVSDKVKFSKKLSSESLHICYMDSWYQTYQYVHDFKLIYFMIFCIFGCFVIVFTYKNVTLEKC